MPGTGRVEGRLVRGLRKRFATGLQGLRSRFVSAGGLRRVFEIRMCASKTLPLELAYL
jgi:hypothetical protein